MFLKAILHKWAYTASPLISEANFLLAH